jgi:hypothetical protein
MARLLAEGTRLRTEAARFQGEAQAMRSTAAWKLREKLLRISPLRRAYRFLRGSPRE